MNAEQKNLLETKNTSRDKWLSTKSNQAKGAQTNAIKWCWMDAVDHTDDDKHVERGTVQIEKKNKTSKFYLFYFAPNGLISCLDSHKKKSKMKKGAKQILNNAQRKWEKKKEKKHVQPFAWHRVKY